MEEADPREEFYGEHHRRLAVFIRGRVADAGIAEQIEQETWAQVIRQWDTLRMPEVVLLTVAWRRIADWYASKGRSDLTPGDDVVRSAAERAHWRIQHGDASDPGIFVPSRVDLQRAVAELPPRQRQVLTLIGVDRLTRSQAAGLLGVGEETIKTVYAQARAAMRSNPALAGYELQRAPAQEVTR
ncbi:RNA polymerase sigma factor [Longispora albida]|uniref:RNA polymerase sigma factor n=1 Tax=Longispora albida TaxID=203523 RepID=UPI0003A706AD|nr:RNA polymerase sigma factor [Longispora albida]